MGKIPSDTIRTYEPEALGFIKEYKPSRLQKYATAHNGPKLTSSFDQMKKAKGGGYKPSAIISLRRYAGESDRKKIKSPYDSMYTKPLQLNGRAGGYTDMKRNKILNLNKKIINENTLRNMMYL